MLKRFAVITSAALTGVAMMTAPASAASYHTSGNTPSSRCSAGYLGGGNWQPLCLFYVNNGTGAIWGQDGSTYNLAGEVFKSGSGQGAGQGVKNNATAVQVEYYEGCGGSVWFNSGYQGNEDWANDGQAGPLYYTWNENASVKVCH